MDRINAPARGRTGVPESSGLDQPDHLDQLIEPLQVSPWNPRFDPGLLELMEAQKKSDKGWPPAYAHNMNLNEWLAGPANLIRLVGHSTQSGVLGHVGAGTPSSPKNISIWCETISCGPEDIAEICRLIVTPKARRLGLSGLLTKRMVRALVAQGITPVATALAEREASVKMMTSIGWEIIGKEISARTGLDQYLLIAPQKIVTLAATNRLGK